MSTEDVIRSIKEISSNYQSLCDELLEALKKALIENMELRQRLKELEND
jgi:hypothetical protein